MNAIYCRKHKVALAMKFGGGLCVCKGPCLYEQERQNMSDDLFGHRAHARRTDPSTSHEAARALDDKLSGLQLKVYDAYASLGGLTNQELCDATGLDWNVCTPRVKPLIDKGWLKDLLDADGKPMTRKSTKTGKRQVIRVVAR